MRNKDTGEFELVVGDKQLLSGFFIGIVLLAVVFAMGYVLGRSSKPSGVTDTAAVTSNSAAEGRPQPSTPSATAPATEPSASTPAASDTGQAAAPAAEAPPQPTTVPARDIATASPPPAAAAPPPADPANATYWQVTAAAKTSADAVAQTLLSKGFPASTRPGPNNLTAVWVGPYTDRESLSRAKKQLEEAGFNPIKKPQ